MFSPNRITRASTPALKATQRISRRYGTGTHGKHGDQVQHFAGSSTEHGHQHAGPAEENLGTQFFVILAIIPASIALYTISRPGKDGKPAGLTNVINSYAHYKEKWATRNALHTSAVEAAGHDRNLFISSKSTKHVDLRFPEIFNTGSPRNLVAGQTANLDELVKHYEKINSDSEAAKMERLSRQSK